MSNYQTVKAESKIPSLGRGDYELVDLDESYWANQLAAGNISVVSVEPSEDEEKVPYDADDDFYDEDDE